MKLLARFKFSLWTLLWLAVLIGAGMGMYAKREPWRWVWATSVESENLTFYKVSKDRETVWFNFRTETNEIQLARLDLRRGIYQEEPLPHAQNGLAGLLEDVNDAGTKLCRYPSLSGPHIYELVQPNGKVCSVGARGVSFTPTGNYLYCRAYYYPSVFSARDGSLQLEWPQVEKSQEERELRIETVFAFHPSLDQALVRVQPNQYEEWDLQAKKKLRTWIDGVLMPDGPLSEEQTRLAKTSPVCLGEYLENGNLLFRKWKSKDECTAWCVTSDGRELWRFSSPRKYFGRNGLFEQGLALVLPEPQPTRQALDGPGVLHNLITHESINMPGYRPLLFPDKKRMLYLEENYRHFAIADVWPHKTLKRLEVLYQYSETPDAFVIDDDHILAHYRNARVLGYFERVRPEAWWGWFYVPEAWIAIVAVFALLFGLLKRLRSRSVSPA